jgi:hypothetical protein
MHHAVGHAISLFVCTMDAASRICVAHISAQEADLWCYTCGPLLPELSRSHTIPVGQVCCKTQPFRMLYNRHPLPTDLPAVRFNKFHILKKPTPHKPPTMSIPEYERYRNSTMFVGSPPFGYEGTDDVDDSLTSNNPTSSNDNNENNSHPSWHPPRVPPHDMIYREHLCPHLGPCQDTFVRSRSPAEFTTSPEADAPDSMKLADVVPALFSSPDLGRLGVDDDNKQSAGPGNSVSLSAVDGERRNAFGNDMRSFAITNFSDPDDEIEIENTGDGTDPLRLLPELMSDGEHDGGGLPAAARCAAPTSSSGGESPHLHDFLRCPECDHVLKWVFVEHTTAEGEHHVHRCQATCSCETAGGLFQGRKTEEWTGGMVQVGRGAW